MKLSNLVKFSSLPIISSLSNLRAKLTDLRSSTRRGLVVLTLAGAALALAPGASAQRFTLGVQFGGPRYVAPAYGYGYGAGYGYAPGYGSGYGSGYSSGYGSGYGYDRQRYDAWRARQEWERHEEWRFHHQPYPYGNAPRPYGYRPY